MSLWLGLDPDDAHADARHLEHLVLELLAQVGLDADLVLTHVVRGPSAPRAAATSRVPSGDEDVLARTSLLTALRRSWRGGFVLQGALDGPVVECGPEPARAGARAALALARSGAEGRAVRFAGQDALTGPLPVADLPLVSAITAVLPVVGAITDGAVLDPSGHVRPQLRDGVLVLPVRPGPGGTLVPVEKRDEHACAGH